jgi:aminopeptidase N
MKLKLLFLTILNSLAMIASPIKTMEDEFNTPTHNPGVAQSFDDSVKVRSIYNASRTLLTDLIHTKLEVSFDWSNAYLIGRETLTAKPHFYP